MDATNILQTITLAIVAWTLREVVAIGKQVAKHDQKLSDLPCGDCEIQNKTHHYEH